MKNLTVVLLFAGSLCSLGLALQAQADARPVRSALDASTSVNKKSDPGHTTHRGQPGEDDRHEESEEDLQRAAP